MNLNEQIDYWLDKHGALESELPGLIQEAITQAVEAYKTDILERAQLMSEQNPHYPGAMMVLELYRAFGWQGGTIHQILAEIKRLRALEQPDPLASYRENIVIAAEAWVDSHMGNPGWIDKHHQNLCSGYLYDRVRYFKKAKIKQQEGGKQ